jgi:hypothetical protein
MKEYQGYHRGVILESRREGDWENLKWFQGIKQRLMNEVVEAYGGPL